MRFFHPVILISGILWLAHASAQSGAVSYSQQHAQSSADEAIAIGAERQLFVDRYLIDSMDGVEQVLNKPVKYLGNPVVQPGHPWEHILMTGFGNVLYNPQKKSFTMWYWDWTQPWGDTYTSILYATSSDGIHWEKPVLNLVEVGGSKANNVVFKINQPNVTIDSGNIIYDEHEKNPARRYKLLCTYHDRKRPRTDGLFEAYSPDGLRWKAYSPRPIVTATETALGISDTVTLLGWDNLKRSYVAYMKPRPDMPRLVAYSASKDFIQWQKPRTIIAPDERDSKATQFYQMPVLRYEGIYIGMLYWYRQAGGGLPGSTKYEGEDTMETQLATSRDGIHWDRLFRDAFIPVGPAGSFDHGMIFASAPVVAGDEIFFYYGGFNQKHTSEVNSASIGLAKLRLDGFVSIDAGQTDGTLTTKLLTLSGNSLEINADAQGGSVAVEILDGQGNPRPLKGFARQDSDTLVGESLHHIVKWEGRSDISSLAGKKVRLKFYLRNAKLYSFRCR